MHAFFTQGDVAQIQITPVGGGGTGDARAPRRTRCTVLVVVVVVVVVRATAAPPASRAANHVNLRYDAFNGTPLRLLNLMFLFSI